MPQPCDAVPGLEALFAATLALMTRWAQTAAPASDAPACGHRPLLAQNIVCNLGFLQHHPAASGQFRQIVANVHQSWQDMACAAQPGAPTVLPQAPAGGRSLH